MHSFRPQPFCPGPQMDQAPARWANRATASTHDHSRVAPASPVSPRMPTREPLSHYPTNSTPINTYSKFNIVPLLFLCVTPLKTSKSRMLQLFYTVQSVLWKKSCFATVQLSCWFTTTWPQFHLSYRQADIISSRSMHLWSTYKGLLKKRWLRKKQTKKRTLSVLHINATSSCASYVQGKCPSTLK